MPYQPTWVNPYMQQNPYQPVMQGMGQPTLQQYQQPVNGITKVNGRDSALQYQLPPNSMSPALFDNNGQVFYIVSTDGTGMKTVEAFDFTPHKEQQPIQIDGAQFVSRQEYDEFVAKVSAALEVINNGISRPVQPTTGTPAIGAEGPHVDAQADASGGRRGAVL